MDGDLLLIAFVTAAVMLITLIAKLVSFFKKFAEKTSYLCHETERADNYTEYCKWRCKLRCHYLCLIPFVNEKNVTGVYRFFFNKADSAEKKERKDSLVPLLLPSVLSIFICTVCVCSMTWAWYTASVQTPAQKMTAAYYGMNVISVKDSDDKEFINENGGYSLTAGTSYTITLFADGSVKECGGYCLIENTANGEKFYTQTVMPENSIIISFTPSEDGIYTFTGVWGSHPMDVSSQDLIREKENGENKADSEPNSSANGGVPSKLPIHTGEPESAVTASGNDELTAPTFEYSMNNDSTASSSAPSETESAAEAVTDSAPVSDIDNFSETLTFSEKYAEQ